MSNNLDDCVDEEIEHCLNLENPQSFFLFAGAGSGKTRSLVNALNYVKNKYQNTFLSQGKQIGVITYTNAACDEIIHRTNENPILHIDTIHGFCWAIIQGFNEDIRVYLKNNLEIKIQELTDKLGRTRDKTSQAFTDNTRRLERTKTRILDLDSISEFTYNPNSATQFGKDSLNHTEVIEITTYFLKNKITFQNIFIKKYPFLLIDESQDTHEELIETLLALENAYQGQFLLGLIGDEMQRIYLQGKKNLSSCIGEHWGTPKKKMNHRSQKRIIELANKIRQEIEQIEQYPRDNKQGGYVHLFIVNKDADAQSANEILISSKMAEITQDELWSQPDKVKKLYLEHRMAAIQQGFINLYDTFYESKEYKTAVLEGSISELSFFSKLITPLMDAYSRNDQFKVMDLIRNCSTILKGIESALTPPKIVTTQNLVDIKKSVQKLYDLFDSKKPFNFLEVLTILWKENLFTIPYRLKEALLDDKNHGETQNTPEQEESAEENVWIQFLRIPYEQLIHYTKYINNESSYATHHGVKGLEFDRVMVIMNDYKKRGRGGLSASYEKLFGVIPETPTDLSNAKEGRETDLHRTRRLFYVTCTRAKESLALVAYTESPQTLKNNAITKQWFTEREITLI